MQVDEIEKLIQQDSLFDSLDEREFKWVKEEILPKLEIVKYGLGDDIIWAEDRSNSFYIIAEGKARVIDRTQGKNITLAILNKGDSFGEHCLLSLEPSPVTVRASDDVTLLKLNRVEFDRLVEKIPTLKDKLKNSIKQQQEFQFLRTLNIFSNLKLSEAYKYQQNIKQIKFQAGEYIFQEGQPADVAYIVRSGNIRLVKRRQKAEGRRQEAGGVTAQEYNYSDGYWKPNQAKQLKNDGNLNSKGISYLEQTSALCPTSSALQTTTLAIVREGDICGETALLSPEDTYPISAIATENTVVLCLPKYPFLKITNNSKIKQYLTQIYHNRQLQYRAILERGEHYDYQQNRQQKIYFETEKLEQKKIKSNYTFAVVDEPRLAGIACLATINRHWHQKIDLQPIIDKKLNQNSSEDIISISRIAESLGYLTCLLHLNEQRLMQVSDFPALVEYNGILCLILSVSPATVTLVNPLTGIVKLDRYQFTENWNRKLLTLKIVPNFGKIGKETRKIFQQFIPLLLPYCQIFAWVGLISFVMQILGLAGPLFSQLVIDRVLVKGDYSLLFLIMLGMLFMTVFQMVSGSLQQILTTQAMKRISIDLLLRFFQHILSLPKAIYSQWQVGDFTTRLHENERLLELVSQSGFTVLINSITSLVYIVILLNHNPKLTGVGLIFVAANALVMLISTPMLRANDRRVFEAQRRWQSHLIGTLNGIETIKSTVTENLFSQEGADLMVKNHKAVFKGALLGFNIGLISSILDQISTVCILGYGAMLVLPNPTTGVAELSIGELVAFEAMLGILMGSLQSLIRVWDEIQQIHISFEKINDVLALPTEKQDPTAIMPKIGGKVKLENVYFRYENSPGDVLQDINLEVLPGEKIAIVGKSGSGKTTLVNLLCKLLDPTQGKIYIDDIDISNIELSSYRRQLGVVEQQPFLFNGTFRANITKSCPNATLEKVANAAKLAGADKFIDSYPLEYDTQIGERGITLSGGQKQRLVIARALISDPRILILDEPTASLDSDSERLILENLNKQTGDRTSFLVAHRLSTVLHADKIIVLDRGRIVETGTHSQLLEKGGLYANLYQQGKHSSFVSC